MSGGKGELMMQDKAKKKKKSLVYKPYQKGVWISGAAVKKGLKLLGYFALFAFIYLVPGSVLQFENTALRIAANLVMLFICAAIIYVNGARMGENEVAHGEIVLNRKEAGGEITRQDLEKCYHPWKPLFIVLVAALPLALLALPHAIGAEREVYTLQGLPTWARQTMNYHEEVALPLQYYPTEGHMTFRDVLSIVVRLLTFPFVNMASSGGADAKLTVDRLSPLLIWLPAAAFPIGYWTGPRSRAMIHGDIKSNRKRYNSRRKKAARARAARTEKKNELI